MHRTGVRILGAGRRVEARPLSGKQKKQEAVAEDAGIIRKKSLETRQRGRLW